MKENKLIAEFMGLELEETLDGLFVYARKEQSPVKLNDIKTEFYEIHELLYHTSWDWLMPVIQKCLIGEAEQSEDISNLAIKNIYEGICNQDISMAYQSVVQFINQHNKSK